MFLFDKISLFCLTLLGTQATQGDSMRESEIHFSPLWEMWRRWYGLIDNFFWYVWRPVVIAIFTLPILIEEGGCEVLNIVRKKFNATAAKWDSEHCYWLQSRLMFQCPQCRSSCLQGLWEKRWARHNHMRHQV